jgi:hypothetical protein
MPDAALTPYPAYKNNKLLRHCVAGNNRPAMLNHRAGRQMTAFGGFCGITTG